MGTTAVEQMDATDEVRAGATSEARPSQLIHVFGRLDADLAMLNAQPQQPSPARLVLTSAAVLVTFAVAGAMQVVLYGGPRVWGNAIPDFTLPSPLGEILVFALPVCLGTWGAARLIRWSYRLDRLPTWAWVILCVAGIASWNLATFVAVNRWGT